LILILPLYSPKKGIWYLNIWLSRQIKRLNLLQCPWIFIYLSGLAGWRPNFEFRAQNFKWIF
jgi:hypothetical protein